MPAAGGVSEIHGWKLGDILESSPGVSVSGFLRASDLLNVDAEMGKLFGIYQSWLQGN